MKVAVTGATGHLGGLVVRELHQRNHTIRALTRSTPKNNFDGIPMEWISGDLSNTTALHALMKSCDAVIHCAGLISIHGDEHGLVQKTNIEGTRNVMEAATANGVKRVIHISSIHAYQQKPLHQTLDEQSEKANASAFSYDQSKKEGQWIALSYASETMEVLVMNPTSMIGPPDYKPSKMGRAIIELCTGKLPFILSGGFDFCDGRDVSIAVVNALSMGRNGESYLLSGKWHSIRDVASMLSATSGQKINVINLPLFLGWMGLPFITLYGRLKKEEPLFTNESLVAIADGNRCISSAKARTELNYQPRSLEETLGDTYRWFLENRYLG